MDTSSVRAGILSERMLDVTRLKEATDLLSSARTRPPDSWSHLSAADDWQRTVARVSVRALAVEESARNRRWQRGGRKCAWMYHMLPLRYEGHVGASRAACRQYSMSVSMSVNSDAWQQLAPTARRLLYRPSCDHHRLGLPRLVTDQLHESADESTQRRWQHNRVRLRNSTVRRVFSYVGRVLPRTGYYRRRI